MYLLDTNICIYAMKNTFPDLSRKMMQVPPSEIVISSITVGELEYGNSKSRWSEQTRAVCNFFLAAYSILPFDQDDAVAFGQLRARLAAAGTPIGPFDTLIAAQALSRNLTVVTHNTSEFQRVPGLLLEDWTNGIPPAH